MCNGSAESPSRQAEVWLGAATSASELEGNEAEYLIALATLPTHQEATQRPPT
jgi:hypothetical protein